MLNKRIAGYTLAATLSIATAVVGPFEGLRTKAYLDPIGIPTICYGHTATTQMGDRKTPAQCKEQLSKDLLIAIQDIESRVSVPMTVERRAGLVSFVYNVGGTKFGNSTLLQKLNSGDTGGACAELSRWIYAGGLKLNGLVTRRTEERRLCEVGL